MRFYLNNDFSNGTWHLIVLDGANYLLQPDHCLSSPCTMFASVIFFHFLIFETLLRSPQQKSKTAFFR